MDKVFQLDVTQNLSTACKCLLDITDVYVVQVLLPTDTIARRLALLGRVKSDLLFRRCDQRGLRKALCPSQ